MMRLSDFSTKFMTQSGNGLATYLSEIRKYKVPTKEEEEALFVRIKNGDDSAKEELVTRNLRFVYAIAKRYAKNEENVLDYVNEGVIGMLTAIDTYDTEKNIRFLTYAVWYIRRSMNYYLTTTNNMIVQSNNIKIGKKLQKIKQKFYAEYGRQPSTDEILEQLEDKYNITVKNTADLYDLNVSSISTEVKDDYTMEEQSLYNEKTASEILYKETEESDYAKLMVDRLLSDVTNIDPTTTCIIKKMYGVGYDRAYTLEELSEEFDIYPQDIMTLVNNAFEYIRSNVRIAV